MADQAEKTECQGRPRQAHAAQPALIKANTPAPSARDRFMARAYRSMGPGFVSPEWDNADGFDEAVERVTAEIMESPHEVEPLLERAYSDLAVRDAMHGLIRDTQRAEDPNGAIGASSFYGLGMQRHASSLVQALTRVAYQVAAERLEAGDA